MKTNDSQKRFSFAHLITSLAMIAVFASMIVAAGSDRLQVEEIAESAPQLNVFPTE